MAKALNLPIWTIYDHPSDYPEHYVARLFDGESNSPTDTIIRDSNLEILRMMLRDNGLVCVPRNPNDDPKIIESWL